MYILSGGLLTSETSDPTRQGDVPCNCYGPLTIAYQHTRHLYQQGIGQPPEPHTTASRQITLFALKMASVIGAMRSATIIDDHNQGTHRLKGSFSYVINFQHRKRTANVIPKLMTAPPIHILIPRRGIFLFQCMHIELDRQIFGYSKYRKFEEYMKIIAIVPTLCHGHIGMLSFQPLNSPSLPSTSSHP